MFAIHAIDHIVLRVRDIESMVAFYGNLLGCTVEKRVEHLQLVHLRAGSALIDLISVDGELGQRGGAAPRNEAHNLDHVCLRIEPFDAQALREHFFRHGVDVRDVASRYGAEGDGDSLYLDDPEGNTIELKGRTRDV